MATTTFNWTNWDSTNTWQNLADAANNADMTYARDATDVAAKFTETAKNRTSTEYARKSGAGDTWESIFGIYPTNTVSQVRITTWKKKVVTNTKLTSHSLTIKLIDDSANTVATMISGSAMATGTDANYVTMAATSLVSVGAAYTSGSSSVRLSIEYTAVIANSSGNSAIDTRFDDITVEITYALTFGITVNNAQQAQTSDKIILQPRDIYLRNGTQAQTSDNVTLSQHQTVISQDSQHAQTATTIALSTPPTTTLGTPNDGYETSASTVDLKFTGFDSAGLRLDYEVQIDTNPTFTSASPQIDQVCPAQVWGTGDPYSLTFPTPPTEGTLVIVAIGQWQVSASPISVIDDCGNTYYQAIHQPNGDVAATMYYAKNITSGSSFIVTITPGVSNVDLAAGAVSYIGIDTNIPLGGIPSGGSGLGTSGTSGSTLGSGSALYFTVLSYAASTGGSIASPFIQQIMSVGGDAPVHGSDLITSGSQEASFTTPNGNWAGVIAAFNSGSGIDAFSTDHTGFSAGESHPTNSGVEQTYTTQTPLSPNTYYWRVRATNTTSDGTYSGWGNWSGSKTFIILGSTTLTLQNATQAQNSDNVVLTQSYTLVVNDSIQVQTSENVALIQNYSLTIADSTQAQTSENIALIQNYSLTIADSTQAQTSENVVLTQHQILVVNDSTQAQTSDNVNLTQHQILVVNDSTQAQTSENTSLTQHQILVVNDSTQAQTSENVALIQNYSLTVNNATQAQTSDNVNLTQHQILVVNDSTQTQTSQPGFPSTPILDDFNRENEGPPLGDNWVSYNIGTDSFRLVNNQAKCISDTGLGDEFWYQSINGSIELYLDIVVLPPEGNDELSIYYGLNSIPTPSYTSYYLFDLTYDNHSEYALLGLIYYDENSESHLINERILPLPIYTPPEKIGIRHLANGDYFAFYYYSGEWNMAFSGNHNLGNISGYIEINLGHDGNIIDNFGGGTVALRLLQNHMLQVNDSTQAQTSDNVALSAYYVITVENAQQAQTSDNVNLTQHPILVVNNSIQAQTSENISLTQHQILVVQNATHILELSFPNAPILDDFNRPDSDTLGDNWIKLSGGMNAGIKNNSWEVKTNDIYTYYYIKQFENDIENYFDVLDFNIQQSSITVYYAFNDKLNDFYYLRIKQNSGNLWTEFWSSNGGNSFYFRVPNNTNFSFGIRMKVDSSFKIYWKTDSSWYIVQEGIFTAPISGVKFVTISPICSVLDSSYIDNYGAGNIELRLLQNHMLQVNDSTQVQASDNVEITYYPSAEILTVQDVIQLQSSENTTLTQNHLLTVFDAAQVQASDNVTITYNSPAVSLTVQNSAHIQIVGYVATFVDGYGGNVNTAKDTELSFEYQDSNYSAVNIIDYNNGAGEMRGLNDFNLSSLFGSTIISASLTIVPTQDAYWQASTLYFHMILSGNSSWTENGATWNHQTGTTDWAGSIGCKTSGTDYYAVELGHRSFTPNEAVTGVAQVIPLNTAQIQAWANGTYFGMVSWLDVGYIGIATSDHATTGYRPKLTVEYIGHILLSQTYALTVQNSTQAQQANISKTFVDGLGGDVFTAKDNTIASGINDEDNYGISPNMRVGHDGGQTWHTLMKFDFSSLPDNCTVTSTTLTIYINLDISSNNRIWRIYRLKREWEEGTAYATPGTSNWLYYDATNMWSSGGAIGADDSEQTDIGSRLMGADETGTVNISLSPTTKAGLDLGYGWLIKADTESNDCLRFHSSDNTDTANLPKLTVKYTSEVYLTQHHSLSVQDATQAQASENVTLTQNYSLSVNNATQPQKVNFFTFTDGYGGDVETAFDNTVKSGDPDETFSGASEVLAIADNTTVLLKFNVSSLTGNTVDSATLTFYKNDSDTGILETNLYPILSANSDWIEACSWNYKIPTTTRWAGDVGGNGGSDAGCSVIGTDYSNTSMGTFDIGASDAQNTKYDIPLTISAVQSWIDNGNYGLCIRVDYQQSGHTIYSSDNAATGYRPKLVVQYIAPLSLTQNYSLTIENATQLQTSDNVALTQNQILSVQDTTQIQISDNVTLTYGNYYNITVNGSTHSQESYTGEIGTFTDGYGGNIETYNDTYIRSSNPDVNYGTEDGIYIDSSVFRGILKFDCSSIPSLATCNSATLYVYHKMAGAGTVEFHELLSGNNLYTETGATWNKQDGSTNWAGSAGCNTSGTDFDATAIGSYIHNSSVVGHEYVVNLTASSVKDWFGATNQNYGMVIYKDGGTCGLESSDSATTGWRPKLVVEYSSKSIQLNLTQSYSLIIQNATQSQTSEKVTLTQHYSLVVNNVIQFQIGGFTNTFIDGYGGDVETYKDTPILESFPTTNYGTTTVAGLSKNGSGAAAERLLIEFDCSSIPSNATCISAKITFIQIVYEYVDTHSVYELRAGRDGWTEAGATWNTYDGTNSWGTAGCADTSTDRLATKIGTFTNPASNSTSFDISLDTTAVKSWFGSINTNYGMLIKRDVETDWQRIVVFLSDHGTPTNRPKLTVVYENNLTQHQVLSVQDTTQTQTSNNIILSYGGYYSITIDDSTQTQTSENVTLTQYQLLVISNSTQLQTSENVVLSHHQTLSIFNSTHIQTSDNTVLIQNYILTIQDSIQLQKTYTGEEDTFIDGYGGDVETAYDTWLSSDAPDINFGNIDNINTYYGSALIKFTLDSLINKTIISAHLYTYHWSEIWVEGHVEAHRILSANSSWTELGATWNHTDGTNHWAGDTGQNGGADAGCSVSGTDYASTPISSFDISGQTYPAGYEWDYNLNTTEFINMVNANYGIRFYGPIVWSSEYSTTAYRPKLVVQYSTISSQLNLTQNYGLTVQNSTQAQTSDNVSLTQHQTLVLSDSTQLQTSENVALTQHQILAINESVQLQISENITLTQRYSLTIQNTEQVQTSENVTLTQNYSLTVQDATQLQKVNFFTFIDGYGGNVDTAYDTRIMGYEPDTNRNGNGLWVYRNIYDSTYTYNSLLLFTLDSLINKNITSATLRLTWQSIYPGSSGFVYRILSNNAGWTETGATWNHKNATGDHWAGDTGQDGGTDAGCDVSGVDHSSTQMGSWNSIGAITQVPFYIELDLTEFGLMIAGNYGIVLKAPSSDNLQNRLYDSDNMDNPSVYHPQLAVEYIVPVILTQNYSLTVDNSTQSHVSSMNVSINSPITTGSDDASETSGGNVNISNAVVGLWTLGVYGGFRFHPRIPHGVDVLTSYISLFVDSPSTAYLHITGEDIDNSPTFTTNQYDISSRTDTTASINWEETLPEQSLANTPTLNNIVNEVVSRDGWSSENGMTFKFHISGSDCNINFWALEMGGTPGNLYIEYASPVLILSQNYSLTIDDSTQLQTSDNVALTQHYSLTVNDSTQLQTCNNITLIYSGYYNISVDNSTQAQTSENVVLTQHQVLILSDSSQVQTSENVTLTQNYSLTVTNAAQTQTSDNVALTQHYNLSVQDSLQTQFTGFNVTFIDGYGGDVTTAYDTDIDANEGNNNFGTGVTSIIGLEAHAFALRFDISSISSEYTCVSANLYLYNDGALGSGTCSIYEMVSGNRNWTEMGASFYTKDGTNEWVGGKTGCGLTSTPGTDYLTPALGSFNYTAADSVGLEYNSSLTASIIEDYFSGNLDFIIHSNSSNYLWLFTSDHATVAYRPKLVIEYRVPLLPLTQNPILTVQDSLQLQTSENVTLIQHYNLSVQNTIQAQTSDNVVLTQHQVLVVNDSTQAQTSDNVALTQHQTLLINDATQQQKVNFFTFTDGYGGDVNTACDTWINGGENTFNYGITTQLPEDGPGTKILLRFDLSSIPSDATCVSAILSITASSSPDNNTLTIYEISDANGDWIEGTRNGSQALSGEPTWDAKVANGLGGVTTPWAGSAGLSTSGIDYYIPALGAIEFLASDEVGTQRSCSLSTTAIKDWFGVTNNGVFIRGASAGYPYYATSDHANTAYRPKLVVVYILPVILTQNYSITVDNSTQIQTSENIALTQNYSLTIDDSTQLQTSDNVLLTQHHLLVTQDSTQLQTSDNVELSQHFTGSVQVQNSEHIQTSDNVVLAQNYSLTVQDSTHFQVVDGNTITFTEIEDIVLIVNYILVAQNSIQAQTSDNIIITYIPETVTLTINNSTQSQTSENIILSAHYSLIVDNAVQAQTVDNVLLTQHYLLTVQNITQIQVSDDVTLSAHYSIIVQDSSQAQVSENISLLAHYSIIAQSSTQAQTSDNITLFAHYSIVVQDSIQLQTSDNVSLLAHYSIVIQDSVQLQSSDAVSLSAHYSIITQDSVQLQTSDFVSLSAHYSIVTESTTQLQTSDNVSLLAHYSITIQDSVQLQTSDTVELSPHNIYSLIVDNSTQTQASDSINLIAYMFGILTMQSAIQGQISDNITLTQHQVLAIQDTTQPQTSDNIELSQKYTLSIQNSTQLQTSDNISLLAHYSIVIQSATQLQTSDNVLLLAHYSLLVNNTTQLQTSDDISLSAHYSIITQNATQLQSSEDIVLIQHHILTVSNVSQVHTSENVVLIQHQILTLADSTQLQTSENIVLTQHQVLVVNNSVQVQASDNISLTQHQVLVVNNATHLAETISNTTIVSDTFSRPDGSLGYTESYPQLAWTGSTWSISDGEAINTPVTLEGEIFSDPGLEGTYVDGKNITWVYVGGTPLVSQSSDVHGGAKAQAFQAQNAWEYLSQPMVSGAGGYFAVSLWAKRISGSGNNVSVGLNESNSVPLVVTESSYTQYRVYSQSRGGWATQLKLTSWNIYGDSVVIDDISSKPMTKSELMASIETSISDAIVSVAIPSLPYNSTVASVVGLVTNLDSTSNPQNFIACFMGGSRVFLEKYVNGARTNVQEVNVSFSPGASLAIHKTGTSVSVYYNNIQIGSTQTINDESIINNTRHGLFSLNPDFSLDNFLVKDFSHVLLLTQHQTLVVEDSTQPQTSENTTLTQHQVLVINDSTQTQTSENVALIQHQILVINNSTQLQISESIVLTQHQILGINDANQLQTSDNIALIPYNIYVLIVNNTTHGQSSNNIDLIAYMFGILTMQSSVHGQTAENVVLTQHQILVVLNSTQLQSSDTVALFAHYVITVNNASQLQTSDNITLTGNIPTFSLVVQNVIQLQSVSDIVLAQNYVLTTSNTIQYQTSENIALVQHQILTVNNSVQAQASDNIILAQNYLLTVNSATQLQTSDDITLTGYIPTFNLVTQSTTQLQTSDNILLVQNYVLIINSVAQLQTSDNVVLIQHNVLSVNNATQAQESTNTILIFYMLGTLTIQPVTQIQVAENVILTQHHILEIQNVIELQTTSIIVLNAHYTITTQNSSQAQNAENVILIQNNLLAVQNVVQAQTSDNISLTQHQVLIVDNSTQLHTANSIILLAHYIISQVDNTIHLQEADNTILVYHVLLIPHDVIQLQTSEDVSLIQHQVLLVNDSIQLQTANNITLTSYVPVFVLTIENTNHVQITDSIELIQSYPSLVSGAIQLQTSEEVILTQHYVLAIDDTIHSQLASVIFFVPHFDLIVNDAVHIQTTSKITFPNYLPPINFKYRKFIVAHENRTLTIGLENRTLYIRRSDFDVQYRILYNISDENI